MQAMLAAPALLLVLLPLSIAFAAFHELGHAAALHYSGGRARAIGVGFYLIYPVFYTDVTDSYRLGRWARVRTDLGGLYFNLIFELGLLALYFMTGQEFFVLAVVLFDLAILYEFMPFARFDGYWALADLTGLPDFFALMGPFVRSVVPIPWWKGPKLPQLKGWVKAVFGLYLLVSVPLLLYLLALLIKNVPRMVGAIWHALLQQTTAFARAQDAGEILGMALAIVQMLILALTTFGLLLVLFNVGYRAFRLLWSWSRPTPGRRVIGVLIASGVGALVAFLWVPQLPVTGGTPTRQDPEAQAVAIERQAPTPSPTGVPPVTPTVPLPTLTTAQSATSAAVPAPVPSTMPTTSQPAPLAVFQQVLEAEATLRTGSLKQ
jgi:putative peptide zinc metalloprotease protein